MKLNKKTITTIALAAIGVSVVSFALVKVVGGGSLPNAAKQTRKEAWEFISSDKFKGLGPEQRREYMRSRFSARREQEEQRAVEFFHTPDDMKIVFLDEQIKEMMQRREEMREFRRGLDPNDFGGRGFGGGRGGRGQRGEGRGGEGQRGGGGFGGGRGGEGQRGGGGFGGGRGGEGQRGEMMDEQRQQARREWNRPENRRARSESRDPAVRIMTRMYQQALRERMRQTGQPTGRRR